MRDTRIVTIPPFHSTRRANVSLYESVNPKNLVQVPSTSRFKNNYNLQMLTKQISKILAEQTNRIFNQFMGVSFQVECIFTPAALNTWQTGHNLSVISLIYCFLDYYRFVSIYKSKQTSPIRLFFPSLYQQLFISQVLQILLKRIFPTANPFFFAIILIVAVQQAAREDIKVSSGLVMSKKALFWLGKETLRPLSIEAAEVFKFLTCLLKLELILASLSIFRCQNLIKLIIMICLLVISSNCCRQSQRYNNFLLTNRTNTLFPKPILQTIFMMHMFAFNLKYLLFLLQLVKTNTATRLKYILHLLVVLDVFVQCCWNAVYLFLCQAFGHTAHLLLHLKQLLVTHLSCLSERKTIYVHVMCPSLMINFPSQVIVFISDLIQILSEAFYFSVKTISQSLQSSFILLIFTKSSVDLFYFLFKAMATC